ncbi:S1C family serine protease [Skermania piniformis]|uniref:S1C family serine protease n=1 Tax=Skermania pinensis TaxID=39122 RepID=A0ABX8SD10_9ACTN|nr:trypsin-like peptidase domain-containing protein [Skermania piniformis]QXQ14325.1 S1C family serine protease [Skermania piniformis]
MGGARRSGSGGPIVLVLLVGVAGGYGYGVHTGRWELPRLPDSYSTEVVPYVAPPPPPPLDPTAVSAGVDPTLVDVTVQLGPFGPEGSGTGIVLSPDGLVLTSHHVIKGAEEISVTSVGNGLIYPATTIGYDRERDIAVLQLAGAQDLPPARIGDSGTVRRGDQVMAIGNANGTGGAPTGVVGAVTGLNERIFARNEADASSKALTGLIAADADVVPGHSGGALVDSGGAVVGVLAAATGADARAETGERAGYAVPINDAMRVVEQVRTGVGTADVHVGPTASLGVLVTDADSPGPTGARVQLTIYGSPAYAAGLPEGATITKLDGRAITSADDLRAAIDAARPGEVVQLDWTDGSGTAQTTTITLADSPPN